ncbi:hypothetical protein T310_3481 [Rasamsonia emersonii CBS 393.64]|uniref:Uncharacterized protein n=1 Tax=Rasamsonia emersonii (strain ATCC 16479 / CBS 393.64 / IMI 116815) TaxID=1408163 RepID=A0A0F4YXX1_RASE3|nr:hypothetical protein T310_3481 [Rasamsonia emersonii CBS 393.64]KKA22483.1 hypothetical protein T310_3481 [Rasamsonia emersonii CBS 393.64]
MYVFFESSLSLDGKGYRICTARPDLIIPLMANNLCLDGEDDIPASPGDSYPLAEMKTEGFCSLLSAVTSYKSSSLCESHGRTFDIYEHI